MKARIFTLMAGVLLIAATAHAHCGTCGVGDADEAKEMKMNKKQMAAHMDKWHHKLGLSEDQAAKMDAAKQTKMEKIAAAEKEYMASVKSILNEEQLGKYMKMMGKHHGDKGSMKGSDVDHEGMKGSHK